MSFFIAWAIFALFPLVLAILIPDTVRGKIAASAVVLAATFALTFGMYAEQKNDSNRWNNGIHIDCGGAYQFSSATDWRGSKTYYYTCDKCGHTEHFSSTMK